MLTLDAGWAGLRTSRTLQAISRPAVLPSRVIHRTEALRTFSSSRLVLSATPNVEPTAAPNSTPQPTPVVSMTSGCLRPRNAHVRTRLFRSNVLENGEHFCKFLDVLRSPQSSRPVALSTTLHGRTAILANSCHMIPQRKL